MAPNHRAITTIQIAALLIVRLYPNGGDALPKLSGEQQEVVAAINAEARTVPRKLRRKFKLSAVETGIVEYNLHNRAGGDSDSSNWRQERESVYGPAWAKTGGPLNLRASVRRYRDEFLQQYDPGETAGDVAAQVQRPREDLRGRYQQAKPQARQILAQYGGRNSSSGAPSLNSGYQTSSRTVPGTDNGPLRQQLKLDYLAQSHDPNALLQLATGLRGAQDTPDRTVTTTSRLRGQVQVPGGASSTQVDRAVRAARKSLGVTEVGGANRGPQVDRIEQNFGMRGEAWCGLFAGTVLEKAGVKGVNARIASTAAIQQDAQAGKGPFRGWSSGTKHARKGDLLMVREGGPNGHVEVITRIGRDGTIHTIGGNVGDAVRRGKYAPGQAFGVAHVRYRK